VGGRPEEPVRRLRRARHLNSPSGRARLRIFRPLAIRDFAFLWAGACVSLLGDGVYLVALAWQVYALSNAPTALSLVGVAWTLPLAIFLLFGGVLSDRMDRRRLLVAADVVRGLAVATIGVLSIADAIELWHLIALAAVFGTGEAFFGPAFSALVPQIVPRHLLVEANSLDQFLRPFAFNLAGPALGGLIVASLGAGEAFLLDAGSFGGGGAPDAAPPRGAKRRERLVDIRRYP
jgi:MFS family permease